MATTTVQRTTPATRDEAFDFIADFTTSQRWDPGIATAKRLDEGPLGPGARFEVRYRAGLVTVPLVYEITRFERPGHLVLSTRGLTHHGEDDVRIEATDDGTRIVWKATFGLRGPGRLLEPLLRRGFPGVAQKAGDGLETCLREVSHQR
jgi:hypothetical protein